MALKAQAIRIVAPIPGKSAIGLEIPNTQRELVHFYDIITSDAFKKAKSKLTLALGKDISGKPFITSSPK